MGNDPHRNAGITIDATGPVSNALTSPKAYPPKCVIQFPSIVAGKVCKNLSLLLSGKIRAFTRTGDKETWKTKLRRHDRCLSLGLVTTLWRRLLHLKSAFTMNPRLILPEITQV
jgi:hypothetical protein